jgi:hypothetical protein
MGTDPADLRGLPANGSGGRRQPQRERYDLIPYEADKARAQAFGEGEHKYGRLDGYPTQPNWHGLDWGSEQSPLSHLEKHIKLYKAGITVDPATGEPEDHLGHASANLDMLLWGRDSPQSPYYRMTYPEALAASYERQQRAKALQVRGRGIAAQIARAKRPNPPF